MSDSLSMPLDFRGEDSLLELLQMGAMQRRFILARGEIHIEEKLSDEGSEVGLQVRVEYQNLLDPHGWTSCFAGSGRATCSVCSVYSPSL